MPDEDLTLVLRLRDEATAAFRSVRGELVGGMAAVGSGRRPQSLAGAAATKMATEFNKGSRRSQRSSPARLND